MSVRSFSTGRRPWFSIMMITNGAGAARAGAADTAPAAGAAVTNPASNAIAAMAVPATLTRNLSMCTPPPRLIVPGIHDHGHFCALFAKKYP